MKMIEPLKRTVGFIYVFINGVYEPIGTGFFAKMREEDVVFVYLITCKHVVDDYIGKYKLYVRLNRSDVKDVEYVPLDGEWKFHKDTSVDLAVLLFTPNLNHPCDFEPVGFENVFLWDYLLEQTGYSISEGDTVAFIGLFTHVTGTRRNLPIYRYGHIAMMADEKVEGNYGLSDYILVECEAYPGNSGSPLYVRIPHINHENQLVSIVCILGVMTAIYLEGEILTPGTKKRTTHNSRISLVVPIDRVKDILLGDDLMQARKQRVGARRMQKDKPTPIVVDPDRVNETTFGRRDFLDALKKVSRPNDEPPDEESPETSE